MSESLEILKKKAEQAKEFISVVDLPEQIEAKLVGDLVFKTDKRGNEGCFITLQTKEGKYVAQKYTQTQYAYLYNAIINCGGLAKLQNEYHIWIKQRVGRGINERLFPKPKQRKEAKAD